MDDVVPAHAHPLYAEGYLRIQNDSGGARAKLVEVDTWRIVEDDGTYLGHALWYEGRVSLALEQWEGTPTGYAVDLECSVLDLGAAVFSLRRHHHKLTKVEATG